MEHPQFVTRDLFHICGVALSLVGFALMPAEATASASDSTKTEFYCDFPHQGNIPIDASVVWKVNYVRYGGSPLKLTYVWDRAYQGCLEVRPDHFRLYFRWHAEKFQDYSVDSGGPFKSISGQYLEFAYDKKRVDGDYYWRPVDPEWFLGQDCLPPTCGYAGVKRGQPAEEREFSKKNYLIGPHIWTTFSSNINHNTSDPPPFFGAFRNVWKEEDLESLANRGHLEKTFVKDFSEESEDTNTVRAEVRLVLAGQQLVRAQESEERNTCLKQQDGSLCEDDGKYCTDDYCQGGVCTHLQKAPMGRKCYFSAPELAFDTKVVEHVTERSHPAIPYEPDDWAYTIPGLDHEETTEVCLDESRYRIDLKAASHTAEVILQIPKQAECEGMPIKPDTYCGIVEQLSPLAARTPICGSRECVLQHETVHAFQWKAIWEQAMLSLQQDLQTLQIPVSKEVCTEEQAKMSLIEEANNRIKNSLADAERLWSKTEKKESELPAYSAERLCGRPKVYAICDQAEAAGWPSCLLCEAIKSAPRE